MVATVDAGILDISFVIEKMKSNGNIEKAIHDQSYILH